MRSDVRRRMISPRIPRPRVRADRRALLGIDPVGGEARERYSVATDHPERAVLRTYELARGLDDSLEELVQIGVELDEEDGVDEGVEPQGSLIL